MFVLAELVSVIGRTLGHLFNSRAYREPEGGSLDSGMFLPRPLSHTLEQKLLPCVRLLLIVHLAKRDRQIAAGEAKNPRRNLPKAIKRVYIRILIFYIGGTAVIGLLVPSTDPGLNLKDKNAAASPFVIAIKHAGIRGLPSVRLFLQRPCLTKFSLDSRTGH
jgi:Amino acid permease